MLTTLPLAEDGSAALPPLPEQQIYGGISPADMREIRVHRDAPGAAIRALKDAAKPWGISVKTGPELDPQARKQWMRSIELNLMQAHEARTGTMMRLQEATDAIRAADAAGGWKAVADLWVDLATIKR